MKILHTADWHIGKRLDRVSRMDEQEEVLAEICSVAEEEDVDLALVAGDLFDTYNPSSDAQELLYRTLRRLSGDGTRAVIAVAGNHDSPDRVTAPEVLARTHGIILVGAPTDVVPTFSAGNVSVVTSDPGFVELALDRPRVRSIPVRVVLAPYANEIRLRRMLAPDGNADATESAPAGSTTLSETLAAMWGAPLTGASATGAVTVLVAHLFFAADPDNPPEEPDEERPIAFVGGAPALSPAVVPAAVQYAACGHLHRAHSVGSGRPVRYSGSPLAYSFAESGQCKSVTIVEVEPRGSLGDEPTVYERPLSAGRPLVRCTADSVETALADLSANQGALVELQLRLPEYLAAADRRRLHDAHDGLISIVPIITGVDDSAGADRVSVDPRGDMRELFSQYFGFKHGVPPDAAILDAFDEVVSAVSATDRDQGETP